MVRDFFSRLFGGNKRPVEELGQTALKLGESIIGTETKPILSGNIDLSDAGKAITGAQKYIDALDRQIKDDKRKKPQEKTPQEIDKQIEILEARDQQADHINYQLAMLRGRLEVERMKLSVKTDPESKKKLQEMTKLSEKVGAQLARLDSNQSQLGGMIVSAKSVKDKLAKEQQKGQQVQPSRQQSLQEKQRGQQAPQMIQQGSQVQRDRGQALQGQRKNLVRIQAQYRRKIRRNKIELMKKQLLRQQQARQVESLGYSLSEAARLSQMTARMTGKAGFHNTPANNFSPSSGSAAQTKSSGGRGPL